MITINETLYKKMPEDIKLCFEQLPNPSAEEVRECFPETKSQAGIKNLPTSNIYGGNSLLKSKTLGTGEITGFSDSGNASRFFKSIIYQAKSSKRERNAGCEELYILKDNTPKEDIDEIKHLLSI